MGLNNVIRELGSFALHCLVAVHILWQICIADLSLLSGPQYIFSNIVEYCEPLRIEGGARVIVSATFGNMFVHRTSSSICAPSMSASRHRTHIINRHMIEAVNSTYAVTDRQKCRLASFNHNLKDKRGHIG